MKDARRDAPDFPWLPAAAAGAAALTVCAFLPALRNGFAWDDDVNFVANPFYRGLGWAQLRWAFTTAHLGPYQPVSWLSSGLDFTLWGLNPFGYHLGNLLLHAANAALVCLLTARLLECVRPRGKDEGPAVLSLCAGAAALLFALHPLRVEAAAWATERRTVLTGLFYLGAVWSYLDAAAAPDASARVRRLGLCATLFLLSLLSKGIGVALPLTLLALDVYPLRRLPPDFRRWSEPASRAVLREKAPFLLLALAFGAVELCAYALRAQALPAAPAAGLLLRAGEACHALVFYAYKTFMPLRLSPSYAPATPALLAAGAAAVGAVSWLCWRVRESRPWAPALWAHYALTLLPVLGLYRFADHVVADRYSYLACLVFPLLAAGALWSAAAERTPERRRALLGAAAALVVAIASLGLLSWRQTSVWRNSVTLWRHALSLEPDSSFVRGRLGRSYFNLGNALMQQEKSREAFRSYLEALRLDPGLALAHHNMGILLMKNGALKEAEGRFRQALALEPENALTHNVLGLTLAAQKRPEEGAASLCRAVSLAPSLEGIQMNLRALLAQHPRLLAKLDADCRHQAGVTTKPAK